MVSKQSYYLIKLILISRRMSDVKYLAHLYRSIGYDCIEISAKTGKNIQIK